MLQDPKETDRFEPRRSSRSRCRRILAPFVMRPSRKKREMPVGCRHHSRTSAVRFGFIGNQFAAEPYPRPHVYRYIIQSHLATHPSIARRSSEGANWPSRGQGVARTPAFGEAPCRHPRRDRASGSRVPRSRHVEQRHLRFDGYQCRRGRAQPSLHDDEAQCFEARRCCADWAVRGT